MAGLPRRTPEQPTELQAEYIGRAGVAPSSAAWAWAWPPWASLPWGLPAGAARPCSRRERKGGPPRAAGRVAEAVGTRDHAARHRHAQWAEDRPRGSRQGANAGSCSGLAAGVDASTTGGDRSRAGQRDLVGQIRRRQHRSGSYQRRQDPALAARRQGASRAQWSTTPAGIQGLAPQPRGEPGCAPRFRQRSLGHQAQRHCGRARRARGGAIRQRAHGGAQSRWAPDSYRRLPGCCRRLASTGARDPTTGETAFSMCSPSAVAHGHV